MLCSWTTSKARHLQYNINRKLDSNSNYKPPSYLFFASSIHIASVDGMFEEATFFRSPLHFLSGHEVILHAILFAGPRLASRVAHREAEHARELSGQTPHQGGLPHSRGSAEHHRLAGGLVAGGRHGAANATAYCHSHLPLYRREVSLLSFRCLGTRVGTEDKVDGVA